MASGKIAFMNVVMAAAQSMLFIHSIAGDDMNTVRDHPEMAWSLRY
jgi:hypothetical protein